MIAPVSLLLFGVNRKLAETRSWVLEKNGYRVVQVAELERLQQMAARSEMALLILCHSLAEGERSAAMLLAQARRPPLKCLALTTGVEDEPGGGPDAVVSSLAGPAGLLAAVARLAGAGAKVGRMGVRSQAQRRSSEGALKRE